MYEDYKTSNLSDNRYIQIQRKKQRKEKYKYRYNKIKTSKLQLNV